MKLTFAALALSLVSLAAPTFAPLQAQTTAITASHERQAGAAISSGTVILTPVNAQGLATPFTDATGAGNGPEAFGCAISAGAITGAIQPDGSVSGTCAVPDSNLTTPLIRYSIQVCNISADQFVNTTLFATGKCFSLGPVSGISGPTWALDHYAPSSTVATQQGFNYTTGTGSAPTGCVAPAIDVRVNGGVASESVCYGGIFLPLAGGGGGSAAAATAQTPGLVLLPQGQSSNTLAKVGITGAYGDLSGLPTIPAPFSGGAVTSPIVLPADPTAPLQATTKQYVDSHAVTAASISNLGTLSNNTSGNAATATAIVPNGSSNGQASFTYVGTPATAPAPNTVQLTQAVAVPSPYSISWPASPPSGTNTVLSCTMSGTVAQCSWAAAGSTGTTTNATSNATGLWFLNEGSGTTSANQGPTTNPLTLVGTNWVTQSGLNGALNFVGGANSYAYLSIANAAPFAFEHTQAFTAWGWINVQNSNGTNAVIMGNQAPPNNTGWQLSIDALGAGGTYEAIFQEDNTYPSSAFDIVCSNITVTTNALHFIAASVDGTNTPSGVKMYVDNVLCTNSTLQNTLTTSIVSSAAFVLGARSNDSAQSLVGNLGPVGVIKRVLTATEIGALYANPYDKIQ